MERSFLVAGALFGMLGVAAGAFGSHLLRGTLQSRALDIYEIGVRYQMYHALALIGLSCWMSRHAGAWARYTGWLWIGGVLLFSGSLLVLATTGLSAIGAVTPLGGTALLAGWVCLILSTWLDR